MGAGRHGEWEQAVSSRTIVEPRSGLTNPTRKVTKETSGKNHLQAHPTPKGLSLRKCKPPGMIDPSGEFFANKICWGLESFWSPSLWILESLRCRAVSRGYGTESVFRLTIWGVCISTVVLKPSSPTLPFGSVQGCS